MKPRSRRPYVVTSLGDLIRKTKIGEPPPSKPTPSARRHDPEEDARSAGFVLERDDKGRLLALRRGVRREVLQELLLPLERPEATLDLHGARARDVADEIARFVRSMQAAGAVRVLIVHGKGLHSGAGSATSSFGNESRSGVLGSETIDALTEGRAASYVLAFATAPRSLGGTGAILVELARKGHNVGARRGGGI